MRAPARVKQASPINAANRRRGARPSLPACAPRLQVLGQPASLRQVTHLVESVAGPGPSSLTFSYFAQVRC